jgi:2-desacetyl-2-hydroxyethyl bacteriochlorophyllide A dehydrogenase
MKTKAIVFTAPKTASVTEADVADPAAGQVLVEASVTHVSTGTESFCYRGQFEPNTSWANWVKYPFHPGYSLVGTVKALGPGVTAFAVGDRVHTFVGHRKLALANVDNTTKIPQGVSDDDAGWSALAGITQTGIRRVEHVMGDTAVIIGLGPLGQLVTRYLSAMGLSKILVIDSVQTRLDLALAGGATHSFLGNAADAKPFVNEHTQGELADVVYDVTGHFSVLPLALPLARQFGKVLLLGDSPFPSKQVLTQDVLARQVSILGTHNQKLPPNEARWNNARQLGLFYSYILRGKMNLAKLVTHRYRAEQAAEMYEQLQVNRESTLGVMVDWK